MARKPKRKRKLKPAPSATQPRRTAESGATSYPAIAGPWLLHLLVLALLTGATCWLYRGDLDLGFFHLDDPVYVTQNPWIKAVSGENIRHVLTTPYFANYSPLHLLSYMLDDKVWGESPWGYHFSSNIWAGIVAGWVYLIGLILLGGSMEEGQARAANRKAAGKDSKAGWQPALFSGLASVLFLTHPAHVEAVAWISSRKDLVAAAFALPSMLAYFLYRRSSGRRGWYGLAVICFTLAVAGKLSVVAVPGVLFLFDWLVEGRWNRGMVLDKIPFVLVAVVFALRTMAAQPETGNEFSFYVVSRSILQSLWLLTGLGEQVLARPAPDAAASGVAKFAWIFLAMGVVLLPWLLRRRLPAMAVGLFYWVLLSLIPSQVLNFIHPVTDRYLFFPSAAWVLLLMWMALRLAVGLGRQGRVWLPAVAALALVLFWAGRTLSYLAEWRDPRSVWYAATFKSKDYLAHQYLGTHYQDQADLLPAQLSGTDSDRARAIALATNLWRDDPRLDLLLAEWRTASAARGFQTTAYQKHLRQLAGEQFQQAVQSRGTILAPKLFFRMGKLALDTDDLDRARIEFRRAYQEAQRHRSSDVREDLTVRTHHALGLVEWKAGNYKQALQWLRQAEAEQVQSGQVLVPELARHRQRLEDMMKQRSKAAQ